MLCVPQTRCGRGKCIHPRPTICGRWQGRWTSSQGSWRKAARSKNSVRVYRASATWLRQKTRSRRSWSATTTGSGRRLRPYPRSSAIAFGASTTDRGTLRRSRHSSTPGGVSPLGGDTSDGKPSPFPYWQHPYDTTFRGPLLAQRQILVEVQQALRGSGHDEDIELVQRICRGFGEFIYPLQHRQQGREPIVIEDEYDVQDFLSRPSAHFLRRRSTRGLQPGTSRGAVADRLRPQRGTGGRRGQDGASGARGAPARRGAHRGHRALPLPPRLRRACCPCIRSGKVHP